MGSSDQGLSSVVHSSDASIKSFGASPSTAYFTGSAQQGGSRYSDVGSSSVRSRSHYTVTPRSVSAASKAPVTVIVSLVEGIG